MNILIWATTFGADLWSFTKYLDQRPDTTVKVALKNPDTFMSQGVASLFPLRADILKRGFLNRFVGIPSFKPDVTVMDNRLPIRQTSPKAFMLWHGFGWKGPNDEKELKWLHKSFEHTWGDARVPNSQFRWQCFGPWDFEHRTQVSKIHPDNCRILGAASHDDLREPIDLTLAQPFYPFDVVHRKTVLIAPTWHYGEVFAHWGTDERLFDQLIGCIEQHNANVILRLHDSYRFSKEYRAFLDAMVERYDHVMLKYKDEAPDNYLDLQVADVLITNYSSIANLFYATRRPTIHVYPVKSADEEFMWRQYTIAGMITKKVDKARYIWKLPPTDHGGLLAYNFDQLLEQVDQALEDPTCCEDKAQEFLDRHMLGANGNNCERTWEALVELVEG